MISSSPSFMIFHIVPPIMWPAAYGVILRPWPLPKDTVNVHLMKRKPNIALCTTRCDKTNPDVWEIVVATALDEFEWIEFCTIVERMEHYCYFSGISIKNRTYLNLTCCEKAEKGPKQLIKSQRTSEIEQDERTPTVISQKSYKKSSFEQILNFFDPMAINVQMTSDTHERLNFCILCHKKFPYHLTKCFRPYFRHLAKKRIFKKLNLPIFSALVKHKKNQKNTSAFLLSMKGWFIQIHPVI